MYGDVERCLGLEESPLPIFKELDAQDKKPMFMLRRHAAPKDGFTKRTTDISAATSTPGIAT